MDDAIYIVMNQSRVKSINESTVFLAAVIYRSTQMREPALVGEGHVSIGCLRPYVSLDSPWCFDFRVVSGVGDGNRRFMC